MATHGRFRIGVPLIAAATIAGVLGGPQAAAASGAHWAGSHESSPAFGVKAPPEAAANSSLREVVHLSIGGSAVRVRLSNRFGTTPQAFRHVTVAVQKGGTDSAATAPGTMRTVRFHGAGSTTVAAGADVTSDPVRLAVKPGANLLISTYLRSVDGPVTVHPLAVQTSFYARGDHTKDAGGAAYTGSMSQLDYVTGVDVSNKPARGSVVAFGDSITDGYASTVNANHRWPNFLADRLNALPPNRRLGVLNAGISGNRLLLDGGGFGPNALSRLDEDVFSRTGVRSMIVLEGINDIQQTPHQTDPAKIEAAYREIVARAHAHGIKVIGGTMTPFKGWQVYDKTLEATRQSVNAYIRNSGMFDAVVDFDAVVRDPADPLAIRPAYDSGDHLHPNDAGYRAMANAIDLRLLR